LRNQYFITIFRDPLAILPHEMDKRRLEPSRTRQRRGKTLGWIGDQIQRLIEFVMSSDAPHVLISYERVVVGAQAAKPSLLDRLVEFLQPALTDPRIAPARRILVVEPPE
jgi:hypothetical protein